MFATTDRSAARTRAESLSSKVSAPKGIGSVVVFYLEDPDQNVICIIQRKSTGT